MLQQSIRITYKDNIQRMNICCSSKHKNWDAQQNLHPLGLRREWGEGREEKMFSYCKTPCHRTLQKSKL